MHSDIPATKKTGYRLSALIGSVFLTALIVVSGIVLLIGYIASTNTIEHDFSRIVDKTKTISKLVLTSKLDNAVHILSSGVQNLSIRFDLENHNYTDISKTLSDIYYSYEEEDLGIFFLQVGHDKQVIGIGAPVHDLSPITSQSIAFSSTSFTNKLVKSDNGIVAIITKREITSASTGKVLGYLYGGTVLNGNLELLSELQNNIDSKAIYLLFNGEVISSLISNHENKKLNLDDFLLIDAPLPIGGTNDNSLSLKIYIGKGATADLENAYFQTLFLVLLTILIGATIGTLLLRKITIGAISSLSDFARDVARKLPNPSYNYSMVRDFNKIGHALKQVVGELSLGEERFRDFAENGADWFWEMGPDLRMSYIAGNFKEIFGLGESAIIGKTRNELYAHTNDFNSQNWTDHFNNLNNHEAFNNFEYRWIKPDGEIRYLSISGKPLFDDNGEFNGFRGVGSDITERMNAQEKIKFSLEKAQTANRAKSKFLATMSHEFRTPLNAILGFSELMKNQFFGPIGSDKYAGYLQDIHDSGEHMLELVNDVLDISSIEAGKRKFVSEAININELLTNCIRNVQNLAENAGVRLTLNLEDELPLLSADKRSLTQILQNLLSNAIKFTDKNGLILLTAINSGETISISVKDEGLGIPAAVLPNVTEPFVQSDTNAYTAEEGTGLGLSIVKSLVEAHSGKLEIKSVEGEGTEVIVTLPQTAMLN